MAGDDHEQAAVVGEGADQAAQLGDAGEVEVRVGLVEQHRRRPRIAELGEAAAEEDALALPAAERVERPVEPIAYVEGVGDALDGCSVGGRFDAERRPVRHAAARQHVTHAHARKGGGRLRQEGDAAGEIAPRPVGQRLVEPRHRTRRRGRQQRAKQRALARAVGADKANDFAGLGVK